jgi:cysteine synthase
VAGAAVVQDENLMSRFGLESNLVDRAVYDRALAHLAAAEIRLPTFAELASPESLPASLTEALVGVDPDAPDPLNLFRVHWFAAPNRRDRVEVPGHVVLPEALTGVAAPIVVAFGDRFPMIHAHKVLAAYGCLAPKLVTGQFDPTRQRAVWPSTGNYCRGGVAISKLLGCRGVAVLPEGMSRERFEWLERWVEQPDDVLATAGSESNVKEIYDACHALAADPSNTVLNQFCEFGNHLAHVTVTGPALECLARSLQETRPDLRFAGFCSASGSAGTLGAGDWLKERLGCQVLVAEPLECPTLLSNGYGEHNIQGIGDKHVPLIHNITNTDVVSGVSDRSTDQLHVLFQSEVGRTFLADERGVPKEVIDSLEHFGLSAIANVLSAIQLAKRQKLSANDAILTVATDGAALYASEQERICARDFSSGFDEQQAAICFEQHILGQNDHHLRELDAAERDRIFNLGYFTWVEQQGVSLEDFERRRSQSFWQDLRALVPAWDAAIVRFNEEASERLKP